MGMGRILENFNFSSENSALFLRAKKNIRTRRIERIESPAPQLEQEKARLPDPS
jgi:hypothetical protein